MSIISGLSRRKRLALGIVVLLLVDIIWVASSELTRYIFKDIGYSKPFFTTYLKTSMFMLYLLGFIFWKPWRRQCSDCTSIKTTSLKVDVQSGSEEEEILQGKDDQTMSEPLYVPVKFNESDKESSRSSSFSEPNDSNAKNNRVRFSNLMEVRHLSESLADEAMLARMSYGAAQKVQIIHPFQKFTVPQVAKISFMFCIVWFLANFSYQEALDETQMTIVNILSSTSGLFTLVLAALFPSSSGDKFTFTKLVAVLFSVGGIVLVCYSQTNFIHDHVKLGSLWALCGAFLYAVYLVMLRNKVDNEDRIDIPMFFGFVGLFNFILIWPGLVALHYFNLEKWEMPTPKTWAYLAVNGLVGTVLSEFLWLWGCFLTSSLIATLSLSLTIPITITVDIILNKVSFSILFFIGAVPVFMSFFLVTILNHLDNWDPLWVFVRWIVRNIKKCLLCSLNSLLCVCRKRPAKLRIQEDKDLKEQSESLIQTAT
ncbi:solute carrier family 35 member F5-like [Amphiura filiformis]|uniref:solute carrier family 35 member F5-like n=1 Tax=Amphiura filiformis TaxID=82378 RepID=UPI003B20D2CB